MGKFEKKRAKSTIKIILTVVILIFFLELFVLFLMPRTNEENIDFPEKTEIPTVDTQPSTAATVPEQTLPEAETEAATENVLPEVTLPVSLDSGKLDVISFFQSNCVNPDYGNQEGKNIATMALKNTTEFLLKEANLTVELTDGTQISFLVQYLPAGKTAMVFDRNNTVLAENAACVKIHCEAVWEETNQQMPDGVTASVDGITVTVTNQTDQEISELVLYCRTPLGEDYFGGIAYEYKINNLPAYGTTTVQALDCIMGLTEVVKIASIDD